MGFFAPRLPLEIDDDVVVDPNDTGGYRSDGWKIGEGASAAHVATIEGERAGAQGYSRLWMWAY